MSDDLKEIKQKLKEIDSAISLMMKEIGHIKDKVDRIDLSMEDTSTSLGDMIDGSLGNLTELLKTEESGGIGDIAGKRDILNNITDLLKKYKPES